MLCRLEISNYALIENVDLTFEPGFTTITGETGAGKSILLKALNLLLGERVDTSVLRQSGNKCFLEATFDLSKLKLESFFQNNALDFDFQCIVRREFTQAGKSRCFINDSPVQLNVLKELGEKLISVHTQHQTLALFDTDFQFDVLDYYANLEAVVSGYSKKYKAYRDLTNQLEILQNQEAQNRKDRDYKTFLLNELIEANLDKLNIETLQSDYRKIQNVEKISEALKNANSIFSSEQLSPLNSLRSLIQILDELKNFDSKFNELHARLLSSKIEMEDVENELLEQTENLNFSDNEAQLVKEKIDSFNALSYKHNVRTIEELISLRNQLEEQIKEIESVEKSVTETELEIAKLYKELLTEAKSISKKRTSKIPELEKTIHSLLSNLAMPDAQLKIELNQPHNGPSGHEKIGVHGIDTIEFMFKTNLGGQFLPIKKIASGGELSRLMLSILSTLSSTKNLPTLIFDEIDTGVSGEVAAKMATEFMSIGKNIQIVVITHLPQVAAKGSVHLHVSKENKETKTVTFVKQLNKKERVIELAKMISGEKITEAAKENAMNLLNIS